jgi:hypothetical protein
MYIYYKIDATNIGEYICKCRERLDLMAQVSAHAKSLSATSILKTEHQTEMEQIYATRNVGQEFQINNSTFRNAR